MVARKRPVRERMSSVDAAWWRMDRPHRPMAIVGMLLLDRRPDLRRLRAGFAQHLLAWPRLRQRPVQDDGGVWWEEDRGFRLARHLTRRPFAGGGAARLKTLLARLAVEPFDPQRPLWELALVDEVGRGAALLVRIHHCYADGIGLVQLLSALSDAPGGQAAPARAPRAAPAGNRLDEVLGLVRDLGRAGADGAANADYARIAARVGLDLVQLANAPDETPTRYKGKPGRVKRVAWSDALPAAQVKSVARAFGCSAGELLLACVAGALGAQLRALGDDVRATEIRALVPVNLRGTRQAGEALGNHFGLALLPLPLGIGNPVVRAWEIHRRMQAARHSAQAALIQLLLGIVGLLPAEMQRDAIDALAAKSTAVVTIVPGPHRARHLAGARIDDMMFWVPQSGDIGLGVSILSYDGRYRIGLIGDARLLPQPQQVIARVEAEFARLPAIAALLGEF
ncbi:MAG: wax ester/triacylglycerol synthase family O-acyltransferase [Rubrivivax sp.]